MRCPIQQVLSLYKILGPVMVLFFDTAHTQEQLDNNYNMVIYIALNRTPNIDCYWAGAVPNLIL